MSDKKIHLPGRRIEKLKPGQQAVVRLTPIAYDALVEITSKSSLSMKIVASSIIMQCKDLIVFDDPLQEEK